MTMPPSKDLAALRARILAETKRQPSPTRHETQRSAAVAIAVGYAAGLGVFLLLGGGNVATRPVELVAMTAIGWSIVAVIASILAVGRGKSMLGRSREALSGIAIGAAPLLFAWAMAATHTFHVDIDAAAPRFHVKCFLATLALAVGPFVSLLFVRRGSDPVHPRATAAAIGAAAGAWGSVLIDLHCPASNASHIFFGHVFPTIALALLGLAAGDRVLGIRAARAAGPASRV